MIHHRGPDFDLTEARKFDSTVYRCQGCGKLKNGIAVSIAYGWACCQDCMNKAFNSFLEDEKNRKKQCLDNNKIYCDISYQLAQKIKGLIGYTGLNIDEFISDCLEKSVNNFMPDHVFINGEKYMRIEK